MKQFEKICKRITGFAMIVIPILLMALIWVFTWTLIKVIITLTILGVFAALLGIAAHDINKPKTNEDN